MALEDYMESEVGVAIAVTAALLSPRVRRVVRRGAVVGLAGTLMVGDAIASAVATGHEAAGGTARTTDDRNNLGSDVLRRGAVAGIATVLAIGDAVSSAARDARAAAAEAARDAAGPAPVDARGEADTVPGVG